MAEMAAEVVVADVLVGLLNVMIWVAGTGAVEVLLVVEVLGVCSNPFHACELAL